MVTMSVISWFFRTHLVYLSTPELGSMVYLGLGFTRARDATLLTRPRSTESNASLFNAYNRYASQNAHYNRRETCG